MTESITHPTAGHAVTFGPILSRRLGQSLGINNIPPKSCSFNCLYCQIGPTTRMLADRTSFYSIDHIFQEAANRIDVLRAERRAIDYLTFVPDGEPTLDINLGQEINRIKSLGKVAVISNASLIWRKDVQDDLMLADWVSLKIDAAREDEWRKVNRPDSGLHLDEIMAGILEFSSKFRGHLVTETMFVKNINDGESNLRQLAEFLSKVKPKKVYLATPIRPPSSPEVESLDLSSLVRIRSVLGSVVPNVEFLNTQHRDEIQLTSDVEKDLLGAVAVHPLREDQLKEKLLKLGLAWSLVERLLDNGELVRVEHAGDWFFRRRFRQDTKPAEESH